MDIKLKNRHRISIALGAAIIIAASFIMVRLYPYFENESVRVEGNGYENYDFLKSMVHGNYVLALEQEQLKQTGVYTPFRCFFSSASEELRSNSGETKSADSENDWLDENTTRSEYIRDLRQGLVRQYELWNRGFEGIRNYLDYQVIDEKGNVLSGKKGDGLIPNKQGYVFQAVLHYDEVGRLDVEAIQGENPSRLINAIHQVGDTDPMEPYYEESFLYEPGLKFEPPRSVTFAYGMTEKQVSDYKMSLENKHGDYNISESVIKIFLGVACGVGFIAFIFTCFDVTLPDYSRILRMPFELVMGILFGGVAFGTGLTGLVANTNQGEILNGLLRANFLPGVATAMERMWNLFWWSVPFLIVYWAVVCLRDVFRIGLVRYFKERTLLGLFCQWLNQVCIKLYHFLFRMDLNRHSNRTIFKIVAIQFILIAIISGFWFFRIGALFLYSVVLFFLIRKYYLEWASRYRILLKATRQIAEGNLEVAIEEDLNVFEPFKKEIQKIQSGFKVAVDEEVKSQKLKTDLISNMSHDLKTPLTAIITYVNLLKEDQVTPEQRKAYVDILEQKSMRLKSLIEDLFEISKANSNNVTLNLENVDIVSLLKEVRFEIGDKIEESTIDFRWNLPDEKIVLPLDGQKTYRIFDNLLTNIIKYGMPNTRAYIDMKKEEDVVTITLKNVSAAELTFQPDDITERFARGDQSRNTEGSGLGLAIAKSFVELQNGKLLVELEADLFRVCIRWPISE